MADPCTLHGTEEFLPLSSLGLLHRRDERSCFWSPVLTTVCGNRRLPPSVCSCCMQGRLPQGSGDRGWQVILSTATGRHAQNARTHTTGHTCCPRSETGLKVSRMQTPRGACPPAATTVENESILAYIAPERILHIEPPFLATHGVMGNWLFPSSSSLVLSATR